MQKDQESFSHCLDLSHTTLVTTYTEPLDVGGRGVCDPR